MFEKSSGGRKMVSGTEGLRRIRSASTHLFKMVQSQHLELGRARCLPPGQTRLLGAVAPIEIPMLPL